MTLRPFAFISGAVLAAVAGVVLMIKNPSLRKPAQEIGPAATSRGPGSAAADPCDDLYRLVCGKKGVTRDPTGLVRPDIEGEKMAMEVYETIIRENPSFSSEQVDQELIARIYTPRNRSRLESAFRWAKHAIEEFVEMQPLSIFTAQERKTLKQRIRSIELQVLPDEPDLLTKNDVFYERLQNGKMRLRVGGAYFFTAKSWFNMIFTLAHEIAHGIDPCEIRNARLALPAYDRLGACFMEQKLVEMRKNRLECGSHDQLSETFADWVAVHVTAKALRNYSTEFHGVHLLNAASNSVRDLCEQDDSGLGWDDEYHPPPEVRIDRIFGANPEIRAVLGCESVNNTKNSTNYCGFASRQNEADTKKQ